ncbi:MULTISPECIES: TetR/AcrR family transcriptional regulator [unclassified Sphingomonas]|uniref:TetR/AcrR family transcriptional regulator n=1 Tax=unclassified Sphingomonas TaxID=196159 RepID=UPI002E16169A
MQHESAGQKRIVDAARHLYATKGFHRTSMAELAAAADVSVGLIYRLFTDKNALIKALVLEDSEAKEAELRALTDDVTSGRVTIEAGFEHLARHALAKGDEALSFDIMAEAHRNSDVADTIATLCLGFRSVVRELACVANPLLTSEALDGAEELVLAFMFGLGHRTLSRPRLSEVETARITSQMIIAALKAL